MWTHLPPSDCQRARQAVSLRLDGELSELEGLWLAGHLGGCPHCRAYDVDTEAFTGALRDAVLDRPAAVFVLPRRRSRGSLVRLAAAASVLVTAASSAAYTLQHQVSRRPVREATTQSIEAFRAADFARQHTAALFNTFAPPVPVRAGGARVV